MSDLVKLLKIPQNCVKNVTEPISRDKQFFSQHHNQIQGLANINLV